MTRKSLIVAVSVLAALIAIFSSREVYKSKRIPKDAATQYQLAETFDDGGSAELDYKRAVRLYKLSADQGYAEAQNALGAMYYYGDGVDEDNQKAAALYQKSANQGNKRAQYHLADMYVAGQGVEEDYKKAVVLYHKSVDQGYAPAEFSLGLMYEYGDGVKQDYKKAMALYEKSASKNDDDALFRLATIYKEGEIAEQNYKKAISLYQRVSEPADYGVSEEIALLYDEGKGVTQDHDAADELYKNANELHYSSARQYLGAGNRGILKLGKPSLRLALTARKTSSFLGGKPLVSSLFEWPKKKGVPLSFIGQLDLSDVNKNKIEWLPKAGRLLFFYDNDEQPWGIGPEDQKGSVVLYNQGVGNLKSQEYPASLKKDSIVASVKYLRADNLISYPTANRTNRVSFSSNNDYEDYYDFLDQYYISPRHQVDGYPSAIQSDTMENECQKTDLANTSRKDLKDDWKMLLQFDSDDDINVMLECSISGLERVMQKIKYSLIPVSSYRAVNKMRAVII